MDEISNKTLGDESINVAVSAHTDVELCAADLISQFGSSEYSFILLFFTPDSEAARLSGLLRSAFHGVSVFGCSTAGELTPQGMREGSIVGIGFKSAEFAVRSCLFENLKDFSMRDGQQRVLDQVQLFQSENLEVMPYQFALLLVDGICFIEEQLVWAIYYGLKGIPLVGGSSGDGLRFEKTSILHNETEFAEAGVLLLVESKCPFKIFTSDSLALSNEKFVVTKADPIKRIAY